MPTVALVAPLFGKALAERRKIDYNSLLFRCRSPSMPSLADTLKSTRFPSASTTSAVVHTSWPAGVAAKVLYIYRSADGAFTCIQKRSYGIEPSVF